MVKGLVLNDIHFGIKDTKRVYEELDQFLEALQSKDIDLLVIAGDYFDSKLSCTDPATFYAISFFNKLIEIIKEKHIIFRMIQGTRSHELNQLQMFYSFQNSKEYDFKIIETVQTEDLLGLHVLYIPEEYPTDADEYYKEFKNQTYNIIFGHGTWDKFAMQSQIEHGNRKDTYSAPVFIFDEWKNTIPHGFISFGHIHGRNKYGNKLFYSGSFSRWNYGERSDKGFTYFEYDTIREEYKVEFINNIKAPRYDAILLGELFNEDVNTIPIQDITAALDARIAEADNLRIDITGLNDTNVKLIREYYHGNEKIKLELKKKVSLKENKEEVDSEYEKYKYIMKKQLPLNKTIQRFCKEEFGVDIDIDTINGIIKEDSND